MNPTPPPRLQLQPYAPEHLLALIESREQFAARFGRPAAPGLREFLVSDEVSPAWLAMLRVATADDPLVLGFAVVDDASGQVLGTASVKVQ